MHDTYRESTLIPSTPSPAPPLARKFKPKRHPLHLPTISRVYFESRTTVPFVYPASTSLVLVSAGSSSVRTLLPCGFSSACALPPHMCRSRHNIRRYYSLCTWILKTKSRSKPSCFIRLPIPPLHPGRHRPSFHTPTSPLSPPSSTKLYFTPIAALIVLISSFYRTSLGSSHPLGSPTRPSSFPSSLVERRINFRSGTATMRTQN
jgi:hypothetical protein